MANYLIQPDGSGACCNCSARVSPCDSCATTCSLPPGVNVCPHAVCFEVNFDSNDTSDGDMFDLGEGDFSMWRTISGSTMTFNAFGWGNIHTISMPLDSGVWHSIVFQISRDAPSATGTVNWSVDGVSDTITGPVNSTLEDEVNFGSRFLGSGEAHRSFRNIVANGDTFFNFPPDSFDSFTGGASIVGSELRIDSVSSDAYALKNFSPNWNVNCPINGPSNCPGTHAHGAMNFQADDGTANFTGFGTIDFDFNPYCSSIKFVLVPVTVHPDGPGTCSPAANVSIAMSLDYQGSNVWRWEADAQIGDHETVCNTPNGNFGWPGVTYDATGTKFVTGSDSMTLNYTTTNIMNASITLTIT